MIPAEQCNWAPAGPDDMTRCPDQASGGVRFILRPAKETGERHGIESLLSFITDLPVCAKCFPKVTVHTCIGFELRRSLARVAQKQNKGIPVDWSRTSSVHVPFDNPEYIALRKSQAANEPTKDPA